MARRTQHQWHAFARPALRRLEKQRPAKRQPFRRQLRIEPLEHRWLLALVTVDTLDDTVDFADGVTSLREAIFATNLVGGADTIDFAPSLTSAGAATITLTEGELAITDSLTVSGPGANLLTIDASGNDPTPDSTLQDGISTNDGDGSRVFNIDDLNSSNLLDVFISGLTLTGGDVGGYGGAIFSRENLTITVSTISGNAADVWGGGIVNYGGDLTVTDSTISANSGRFAGGGIRNLGGVTVITNSTISGNSGGGSSGGGGILSSGVLTVTGSTISGNSAVERGGGILHSGGTVSITNSTISNNRAKQAGGIWSDNAAVVTVSGSTISDNMATNGSGGGIVGINVAVTVTNSIVSGNSAIGSGSGGGIWKSGTGSLTVTNSSIRSKSLSENDSSVFPGFQAARAR